MLMETRAGCTFNVAVSKTLPMVALIVEVPGVMPVESPPLLIAATAVLDELQVTLVVIVFVLLSVYVPVTTNCCVPPVTIVGIVGVTRMVTSAGAATVSVVEREMLPDAA
jgi:hypothetical protein